MDEPTKLRQIVVPLLAKDPEQEVRIGDESLLQLVLGALDQDDCAAYRIQGDATLVVGSDYVRGTSFFLYEAGYLTDYDIGWYLAGANFADIAAMGAKPIALLSVIRYPKNLADERFESLLNGIVDSCRMVGALNVGGDIGTAEAVVLSGTGIGLVEPDRLLSRSGAKPGDVVCLTGVTGEAGAAMKLAREGKLESLSHDHFQTLLKRWQRVTPRVAEGRILARVLSTTSCVDTSDGLKAALQALAAQSGVRITVNSNLVPVSRPVQHAAELLSVPTEEIVLGDSVDFELVATVRADGIDDLRREFAGSGLTLHVIGDVAEGQGVSWRSGSVEGPLPGEEWRH